MTLPVVLRPEASQDAREGRDPLESQQAGLGQAFLDRLNETLAGIGAMPELYGVVLCRGVEPTGAWCRGSR